MKKKTLSLIEAYKALSLFDKGIVISFITISVVHIHLIWYYTIIPMLLTLL